MGGMGGMRRGHRERPGAGRRPSLRTKALITATAVVVAGAGIAGVMRLSGFGQGDGINPASVAGLQLGRVDTVSLTRTSSTEADLPARTTKHEFTTVGVTWNDPKLIHLDGTVQVRTKSADTGQWSGWRSLPWEDSATPGQATRGGTGPAWVGLSDGVQVRVRAADGSTSLPAGLNVALVDPNSSTALMAYQAPADTPTDTTSPTDSAFPTDTATPSDTASPTDSATAAPTDTSSPTDSASPTDTATASASPSDTASPTASASASATPSPSPTTASELPTVAQAYPAGCPNTPASHPLPNPLPATTTSTVPAPPMVTRAGWQADECVRKAGYPAYGPRGVQVVFVHHTDDTNDYTCADSPSLVRATYLYHVKTEGWDDIGYNFLVDKCGTIFEGRFGGAALPVTGAQTYGFNTNSTGIAAIGTYTNASGGDASESPNAGATPTTAMLRSIAWIAAWKLGMNKISPTSLGTQTLVEGGTGQKWATGSTVTFNAISGHRDGYATDCPGNQLYNDLATIRSYAANPATFGASITKLDGGAVQLNSEWVAKSAATVHWAAATTSSSVTGYEVLVDGVSVAKAASTATSAAITVSGTGTHSVVVQTDYGSGVPAKSAAVTLVADNTPPSFPSAPVPVLRTGATASTTSVPVTVSWAAAKDNTKVASVAATSPSAATFAGTATSWSTTAKPGTSNLYALKATDIVGNTSTTSASRTPSILLPASSTRTGTWARHNGTAWLGGYSYWASKAGSSISFKATGKSFALIATCGPTSGSATVYVDGVKITGINLNTKTTYYRHTVWARNYAAAGTHTVKIVVAGTSGHPVVAIEGLAALR